MIARFRNLLRQGPRWLYNGDGGAILRTVGLLLDAGAGRLYAGLRSHFPRFAERDALLLLAKDHGVKPAPGETDAHLAERVVRAIPDWKNAGGPFALIQQLRAYIGHDLQVRIYNAAGSWFQVDADGATSYALDTGEWDWDDLEYATNWSRFWVILFSPDGVPWSPEGAWGDGEAWGESESGWGSTMTPEEASAIKSVIRQWKPAGSRCETVILAFDLDDWQTPYTDGETDGTQGGWHVIDAGIARASRPKHSRYFRGY